MLLVRPIHSPEFLTAHALGVETHITRDNVQPSHEPYIPFVRGIHLPYAGLNLAALDEAKRKESLQLMKNAVIQGAAYQIDRMVMHPCGVLILEGKTVGCYDNLIKSLREIAAFMAEKKLLLCLENQMLRPAKMRTVVACSSEEWFTLRNDVDMDNVCLTFDSSHAASFAAHQPTYLKRCEALMKFWEHPEWIGRIHWSDSMLKDESARYQDLHLVPGRGDLPRELHCAIKSHPAIKLLEQRCSSDEVLYALDFINEL